MSRRRGSVREAKSPTLPYLATEFGRTETGDADEEGRVLLVGPSVAALREWLDRADIKEGRSFGRSTDGKRRRRRALTPQSVNLIVKRRCANGGVGAGGGFSAGTAGLISDRGGRG
jgi:hypothetical protein